MANTAADPVEILRNLIRCPSVTPEEGGALALVDALLSNAGFATHRVTLTGPDTPDVENLYARFGTRGPNLCFAGHTDVVPPGDAAHWRFPPFEGAIQDGLIYGRGAVDMKGGVAAFLAAGLDFAAAHGHDPRAPTCRARSPSSSPATRKARPLTAPRSCCAGSPTATSALTIACWASRPRAPCSATW